MSTLPPWVQPLPHGIDLIDTGFQRPQFDASYLLVDTHRAAFIDTGANDSVPRLLAALAARGLGPDAVDWVIATHVHLDHAGGVGLLMQQLPYARLLVHPRGAPHLVDPTRLVQGAQAVYGIEAVARTYGTVVGVPSERVTTSFDGMTLQLGRRILQLFDTPGHARHHHCIWDARSQGIFTGDTFGLSYPELDTPQGRYILPSSTPVQFDPDALCQSVRRLMALQATTAYLTHFGPVTDLPELGSRLLAQVNLMVDSARSVAELPAAQRHPLLCKRLASLYLEQYRALGGQVSDEALSTCLSVDIELNAQGLGVWLDAAAPQH